MDVRLVNVSKEFDRFAALNDVSLDIVAGELIAILGPSGSGKSTLLRLIAGLDLPTKGQVFFGDLDAANLPVQARKVGLVFQHYALFKHLTILQNVAFGLNVRPRSSRPPRNEIRRRALELLDLVQLAGLETRYPGQLSGGQRQRVALARALAIEPAVLLLDEPFGALDTQVRRELRTWLRDLHDRTGHTTVLVTHDQAEALELADRVCVMRQGRIEQIGTPEAVYDTPSAPFVFSFVGPASQMPAVVAQGEVLVGGRNIGGVGPEAKEGAARLMFRPHDVELVEGDAGIVGLVTASRRIGGSRRIELKIEGIKAPVEIDLPFDHPAAQQTRVAFRPRRWRLYPPGEADGG